MAGPDLRLAALRRFATAITVLNVAGYTLLGFEPAWAHPLVALATAYVLELLLETLEARSRGALPGIASAAWASTRSSRRRGSRGSPAS